MNGEFRNSKMRKEMAFSFIQKIDYFYISWYNAPGGNVDEVIFVRVIQEFNRLCLVSQIFPSVLSVRRGDQINELVFETTLGEINGHLQLEGNDLIILIGNQEIILPLLALFNSSGKPN